MVSPLLELGVNEVALEVELAETPPQEARLASKTLERRNNAGFFMKEVFDKDPRAVDHIKATFAKLGITPKFNPIRGGTDGATFSFKGCPTPNLGTGSYNHHGRYEYLSVSEFNTMVKIVIALLAA